VRVRADVICCGQPFSNSGSGREGDYLARLWHERMAEEGCVVVLSSSCTVQLRHAAAAVMRGGPEIREFCEFLDARHPAAGFGRLERTIALHSACHGLRDSDADARARAVLSRVAELRTLRPSRSEECCGFGGTFATSFPDLSVRMGEDRLNDLLATGAREVAATDLSCLLHLEGIAAARGKVIAFRHVAEILSEAMRAKAGLAGTGREGGLQGAGG
jgi:L-lactate dehydrogenase complex protein LldE